MTFNRDCDIIELKKGAIKMRIEERIIVSPEERMAIKVLEDMLEIVANDSYDENIQDTVSELSGHLEDFIGFITVKY